MSQERKKRILLVSDSPKAHSGLSRVVRDVFVPLFNTGKYHIEQHAWYDHPKLPENVPWNYYTTRRDEVGNVVKGDEWGQISFDSVVSKVNPDIVVGFGDPWMVEHILDSTKRSDFMFIAYCCVDSEPIDIKYKRVFQHANQVVAFGEWAQRVIKDCFSVDSIIIPHGVQTNIFKPNKEAGERFRANLRVRDDQILMGTVARNQGRKNLGIMFEYVYRLNCGGYLYCEDCGRITLTELNRSSWTITDVPTQCKWCNSTNIQRGLPTDKYIWYFHGAVRDVGWDMLKLAEHTKTLPFFRYSGSLMPVHGVKDEDLNVVYNAMDVFNMPTTAEGFGLPILEAMSAGVPVILPRHSAYLDWAPSGGIMVDVGAWFVDPAVGSTRAYISMEDWIKAALEITDPVTRKALGDAARTKALEYDYSHIVTLWENLFDNRFDPETVTDNWRRTVTI